jgi:hypothetical protein
MSSGRISVAAFPFSNFDKTCFISTESGSGVNAKSASMNSGRFLFRESVGFLVESQVYTTIVVFKFFADFETPSKQTPLKRRRCLRISSVSMFH